MQDHYEAHFVLPNDCVLLITDARVSLVKAPGFAQLEYEALSGSRAAVDAVPPGSIKWQLEWATVLAAELSWSSAAAGPGSGQQQPGPPAPNAVLIHRCAHVSELVKCRVSAS